MLMIDRILIVGFGSIGKRHLKYCREIFPKADIKIFRHTKSDEVPELSNGCLFKYDDVINFKPHFAIIANPASQHIKTATILLENDINLLIEKPIASSLENVDNFIELSKKSNAKVLIGYNLRFLNSLQNFKKLILSNSIGSIFSIRLDVGKYLPSWRPDKDYRDTVSAQSRLGGGVLLELSHEIDYLRWIFGEVDWVYAKLSKQSNLEVDVEDTAHLLLGVSPDSHKKIIASINMDFVRHDPIRMCTVIGDKGTISWNGLNNEIKTFNKDSDKWIKIIGSENDYDDSYKFEINHLVECIIHDKRPKISIDDGLKTLKIIEAAKESSKKNIAINLV